MKKLELKHATIKILNCNCKRENTPERSIWFEIYPKTEAGLSLAKALGASAENPNVHLYDLSYMKKEKYFKNVLWLATN